MHTNYYPKISSLPEWLVASTGTLPCPDNRLCNRNTRETLVPYCFRHLLWVSAIWYKLEPTAGRLNQLSWQTKLERSLFPSWCLDGANINKQKLFEPKNLLPFTEAQITDGWNCLKHSTRQSKEKRSTPSWLPVKPRYRWTSFMLRNRRPHGAR